MRVRKWLMSLVACLLCVAFLCGACAEPTAAPTLEEVEALLDGVSSGGKLDLVLYTVESAVAKDGKLRVRVHTDYPSMFANGKVSLELNDQPLPLDAITVQPAMNYLLLVDNAPSLKGQNKQINDMVAFCTAFAGSMRMGDTVTLQAVNDTSRIELTQGASATLLNDWLDALSFKGENSSLYDAVAAGVASLAGAADDAVRKRVVVLSDGLEDSFYGLSQDELVQQLTAAETVVHTVASVTNKSDATGVKNMGAWSRATGGVALLLNANRDKNDETATPEAIAKQLLDEDLGAIDICCSLPEGMGGFDSDGSLSLFLIYKGLKISPPKVFTVPLDTLNALVPGGAAQLDPPAATDAPAITEAPVQTEAPAATATPDETVVATEAPIEAQPTDAPIATEPTVTDGSADTTDDVTEEPTDFFGKVKRFFVELWGKMQQKLWFDQPIWLFAAIGAGLLIALLILWIVLAKRSKRRKREAILREQDEWNDRAGSAAIDDAQGGETAILPASDGETESPELNQLREKQRNAANRFRLILTQVNVPHPKQYVFESDHAVVAGRSSTKADWAFPDDVSISGSHCRFERYGNQIFVTDLNSTNGTRIGNNRITDTTELHQDELISFGDSTYRFNWMSA